ncbi:hypothetical protein L226DRAFT_515388 [Lentinus tigrinus ALCF2SS1-7]|uniref:YDG domain-containing protein n=1 Tax=Lentinus tigrinus ALCF2SS1-6 TaxID=1328759 RepID=A0A5C2RUJ9_9APHY|nr:hypothetical protein L227DRAFT_657181 [Lentinus tigrinus ALCF2SS1-6]RPD69697.1 hypothetical protein L226DRAFT_515388 [Lentinus tigrinus ALCF2SS1-7]
MGFKCKPIGDRTTPSNVFGHIPGVPVGSTFENRMYLHHSSVHSGIVAGIYGTADTGCYSVVLSGGYEDDIDNGDTFIYTGCGGRDNNDGARPRDGPQTCDQDFKNTRNASLKLSAVRHTPVRVVRGFKSTSNYAPTKGFRYDGLYEVDKAWLADGKSGHKVCKFRFRRLPGQRPIPRRDGAYRGKFPEYETPKHFGHDTVPSVTSESVPLVSRNRTERDLSHRPRPSPPPQATRPRPPVPAIPIPPTSNAVASRSQPPPVVQKPVAPSEPNVYDLLAEWNTSRAGH